jgi:hypothetical protein
MNTHLIRFIFIAALVCCSSGLIFGEDKTTLDPMDKGVVCAAKTTIDSEHMLVCSVEKSNLTLTDISAGNSVAFGRNDCIMVNSYYFSKFECKTITLHSSANLTLDEINLKEYLSHPTNYLTFIIAWCVQIVIFIGYIAYKFKKRGTGKDDTPLTLTAWTRNVDGHYYLNEDAQGVNESNEELQRISTVPGDDPLTI